MSTKPLLLKFGGYQEPASIHNRAAGRFGDLLKQKLGDRIAFELIGSVLKIGRPSGDLPVMVDAGELDFCYMSTVRFAKWVPELKLLELPFVVKDRKAITAAFMGDFGELIRRRMGEKTPYRLLGLCDRIYTLAEGVITREFDRSEATQESLMRYMTVDAR